MVMNIKIVLPFLMMFFLGSCQSQKKNTPTESAKVSTLSKDGILHLKLSERKSLKTEDINVKFVKVTEDSRCPKGMECIWAGIAAVELELSSKNMPAKSYIVATVDLSQRNLGKHITFNGYQITLQALYPEKEMGKETTINDVAVDLKIEKAKSSTTTDATTR